MIGVKPPKRAKQMVRKNSIVLKRGDEFDTNSFGKLTVINRLSPYDVKVKFNDTGFITTSTTNDIIRGRVRDRLHPSVFGVGFIGSGKYTSKDSRLYKMWSGMLMRCYYDKFKEKHKCYDGCSVSKEWHNFQTFADWVMVEIGAAGFKIKDKFHLDKDIKLTGNKVYSPSTCSIVSAHENVARGKMKVYMLISPDLEEIQVGNLMKFCRENDLTYRSMINVMSGKAIQHKGWKRNV